MAYYIGHMATKRKKRPTSLPNTVGLITAIEILTENLDKTQDWNKFAQLLSRKNAWIVHSSGDVFSHYLPLVWNLTRNLVDVNEPTFSFLRSMVKEGLPRSAFDRLKSVIATTTEELSLATSIPVRTVARRERFKPDESERLLRVASVFQKALELFEDLEKARKWFTTPKSALSGLTPIVCCDTETGAKEVENLLGRIDESVYS